MKLDKIKFAKVVQYITNLNHQNYLELDVLDELIDIDVEPTKVNCYDIDELLHQIISPDGYISAIKTYRALTGANLKDSKEAIERYRKVFLTTDTPD